MKNRSTSLKKRHFQLLEMMVAVVILLACAAPALRIYTNIFLHEQEDVRQNTRNRFARRIHSNIVEKLYRHTIPFGALSNVAKMPLEDPELNDELKKNGYTAFYRFDGYEKRKMNLEDKEASLYLVSLKVVLCDSKLFPGIDLSNASEEGSTAEYDYKIYVVAPEKDPDFDSPIDEDSLPNESLEEKEAENVEGEKKNDKKTDFTKELKETLDSVPDKNKKKSPFSRNR